MFGLMKGVLGYSSPKGWNEETRRDESPALVQKQRDQERPEMPEGKRAKVTEQTTSAAEARESSNTKERSSMDRRRKDSARGHGSSFGGSTDEQKGRRYERWEQPLNQGRLDSDILETSSMKEQSSTTDSKKKGIKRGRSYSASAQDISSMTRRLQSPPPPPPPRAKETPTTIESGKREVTRGRASSVVRRDGARSFEFDRRVVDDRSAERSRKRRDVSAVRDPNIVLQEMINHNNLLKTQLGATQDALGSSEQRKIELHRINNSLLDERTQLIERESAAKRESAVKEREAQQKITELLVKNRRQEDEIRHLKERLRYAEEKNSHTSNLLQVRTADLRGAEAFLTTADQYSGADIINLVNILNAEIFQAAAYMAELLEDPSTVATEEDRKRNLQKYVRSLEDAHEQIGDRLFAYFLDKGSKVRGDPLPLQLALQSLFCRWCASMINRFCTGNAANDNLTRLYQEIQTSESQAVAGRWRAMTHANIKPFENQTYSDQILDMAISLLCFCGWSLNSPRSQKAILAMQHMVKVLEKAWIKVKSATKESITTADIDVFSVDFDRSFDETRMEDNYCDKTTSPRSTTGRATTSTIGTRVLCPVGVGVQKTVVKRVEGMTPPSEKQVDVLIRAKVALETVLRDIGGGVDGIPDKVSSPRPDRR